jgi:hypothetical protein
MAINLHGCQNAFTDRDRSLPEDSILDVTNPEKDTLLFQSVCMLLKCL